MPTFFQLLSGSEKTFRYKTANVPLTVSAGIFSKCPQNKMAYEVIMVYHLHMPFFIALFPCILT